MSGIAQTIYAQLGGTRLRAMIGAKDFIKTEASLTFSIPCKTTNRCNRITVTLCGDDTYQVEFFAIRATKLRQIEICVGCYADKLQKLIEDRTGLYLSFGTPAKRIMA